MKCPYCDTEFDMDTLKSYDEDLHEASTDNMDWNTSAGKQWADGECDGMRVYVCNSCGGEIIGDSTTAATSCPYCGNPVIVKENFAGDLRPDFVVPFKLDKKAAKDGLLRHFNGKKLLPKIFKDENHLDEIKGVYVPFWLFNADVNAQLRFKGTKLRVWADARYNYTETSFFSLYRNGSITYENVPVDGSTKMPDALMESLEPFDMSEAVDFQTAYLAGYFADRYDVTAEQSVDRANSRIKETTETVIRNETCREFSSVTLEQSNFQFLRSSVKYALLPVWILNTTWNGKNYQFAMNGQTGKFIGDLPVDRAAYWKWIGIYTAIFSVLAYVLIWLITRML